MLKEVFSADFQAVVMRFSPWKIPKCLEWMKNGSKMCFSKSDTRALGVHKPEKLAHFEPVLIESNPFRHMYAPSCTLRTYLGAVWCSHLELGRRV